MKRALRILRNILLGIILLLAIVVALASLPRVPQVVSPNGQALSSATGWDPDSLQKMVAFAQNQAHAIDALYVTHQNQLLVQTGQCHQLINSHSVRKSIISVLIGIAIDKGLLSADQSLAELGIDESKTPLTSQEKTATVRDLLMARSGIYLPAEAERQFARDRQPQREQHRPGAFFFYNNFDCNALGTILEQASGQSIGQCLQEWLAVPLGMQDFAPENVVSGNPFFWGKAPSDHRVFSIYISARDLARIGLLMANQGQWQGKQIVSQNWVAASTQPYSPVGADMWPFDHFAYSWWCDQDTQTIWADGYGGQFMLVDPKNQLVIVALNFTGNSWLTQAWYQLNPQSGRRSDVVELRGMLLRHMP
jgi:CubicO group peptidase (beta-lactamase class C family)